MKCKGTTLVYSRVTGYFQPVQQWNDGKVEEFKDRKKYEIEEKKTSNNSLGRCNHDSK